jgi:hypothetical protein
MQDSYDVTQVNSGGFHARSVIGGVFIRMLTDFSMWQKYASHDHTVLTGWAGLPTFTPILPNALTSPQTWKYTTAAPTGDWTASSFNDAAWSSGLGGFGTSGTPGAIVNTTWNSPDIYLRKSFTMPSGSFSNLQIQAYHDEDMQVYINGILATSVSGYATNYQTFDISPAALAQLTPGATVEFAVHCHQTGGGQDIDVGLVTLQAATAPPLSRPLGGIPVKILSPISPPASPLKTLFPATPARSFAASAVSLSTSAGSLSPGTGLFSPGSGSLFAPDRDGLNDALPLRSAAPLGRSIAATPPLPRPAVRSGR